MVSKIIKLMNKSNPDTANLKMDSSKSNLELIFKQRIAHKSSVVINFNNWSILCKQLWIGGLAVLFWNCVKPLFLEKKEELLAWSVTLVNRAILGGIVLTVLFWCLDGVTWFFQRQLRRDVEKMELMLWQLNNPHSQNYLGITEWDCLTKRGNIDSRYIYINRPTFLSSVFNKSLLVYMIMCLFLACLNLFSYVVVNRDIRILLVAIILVVSLGKNLRRWYEINKREERTNLKMLDAHLIKISGFSFILLYIGVYSILKKFYKEGRGESLGFIDMLKYLEKILAGANSEGQAYENLVIFIGIYIFCAIILCMGIKRARELFRKNNEKLLFVNKIQKHICVLYSFKTSKITENDLREFYKRLRATNHFSVFIDYINNYNNQYSKVTGIHWRDLVKDKIRKSDFVVIIDPGKEYTKSIRYEMGLVRRYRQNRILFSVDEVRRFNSLRIEQIEDFLKFKGIH